MNNEEISSKYAKECISSLYIILMEHLIPYTLQRDFYEELKDFEIIEAFECMEDEIKNVKRCIELYDVVVEKPILLLNNEDIMELLEDFILFQKEKLSEKSEELSDVEKDLIDDYLENRNRRIIDGFGK